MLTRGAGRKYLLLPGSELLRVEYWKRAHKLELMGLIKRFATRERRCRSRGKPTFRWRNRRLAAVAVFEARFERPPEIFCQWALPAFQSFYVHNGRYVWPEHGQPGDLVSREVRKHWARRR